VRDERYDIAKGVAIILVVVGHSIQFHLSEFDDNPVFRAIYSFHMPLFMAVSGAVAALARSHPSFAILIARRAQRLLVPFFSWALIFGYWLSAAYMTESMFPYLGRLVKSPGNGLWFLWVLFFAHIILWAAQRLEPRTGLFAYALVLVSVMLIPLGGYGVPMIKAQIIYFLLGYLVVRHADYLRRYATWCMWVSLVAFPVFALFWRRQGPPVFLPVAGIAAFAAEKLYGVATALAGIGFSCFLVLRVSGSWGARPLAWVGKHTLEIYFLHFFFVIHLFAPWDESLVRMGGVAFITLYVAATLAVCLALDCLLLSKVRLLRVVLFGTR